MIKKTESIYIRATIPEKEEIERLARAAGKSISSFILNSVETHLFEKEYRIILCPVCRVGNFRRSIKCKNCKRSY